MLNYKLAPVNLVPATPPVPGYPRALGQGAPPVSAETAKSVASGLSVVTAVGTLLMAGNAWVGYSTGVRERGLLSALGWVVAVGASLGVLGGLSAMTFAGKLEEAVKAQADGPKV